MDTAEQRNFTKRGLSEMEAVKVRQRRGAAAVGGPQVTEDAAQGCFQGFHAWAQQLRSLHRRPPQSISNPSKDHWNFRSLNKKESYVRTMALLSSTPIIARMISRPK